MLAAIEAVDEREIMVMVAVEDQHAAIGQPFYGNGVERRNRRSGFQGNAAREYSPGCAPRRAALSGLKIIFLLVGEGLG